MDQFSPEYKLTIEESTPDGEEVFKGIINAGDVYDSEGKLHIKALREQYDMIKKKKDGTAAKKDKKKKGKK